MPLIDLDSYEPPAPEPRGIIRGAADTAVQFGKGAVTGVRMLSDTFGADNAVSGKLRSATEALDGLLSASAQQDQRRIAEIMEEAEGKGWGEQIVAGLKAMGVAPGALIAQGLGTAAPTIAASLIPGVGPAAVASRIGAAGIGAAQGAGSIKGSIYETTKAELLKAGATEAEAEARAVQAQEYAGPNTGQIALGAGLGVLAGTTGAEHAVSALRNGITKTPAGIIGRVLQTGAAEAIPEFAQGGQEKLATNLALANEGFNVDPSSGILANATLEGLAGFGVGAGFGIKAPRENKPPADKPADPAAPLMLGNTPDPIIVFPDGTAGRRADLEAYINNLPEDQRVAARAKLMGMGARDVTPADILSASSADDAIAKFAASITGSDLSASLGQDNPLIAASRDMQAQAAADEADLADLAQSEARDLNTMRAMAAEDARKQQELDALQATGTGQYGIQPEARPAVEAAATVQAPSIMQMAMQRAQQRANPQPAATTVPEVEQRLAAAQQELAAAAPAPIQRQPDILPGDISREDGMPFRTESGAKFKQRYAGGIDGSEIIPVQGGWVVRPKAAPTDPAAAAPGQAAGMQPAASRVPGTVDPAQQGLPALNPSTNGEPADAQAAQAVQSPPQRQEPTARAAPVPAPVPDPVQPAEGGAVSTKAQTDQRLIPVSRRGGTPLTPEENRQNSIAADAGELAMQLQNESAEPDFDPKEATQAIKNWAEGRNYTEDELRAAVIADLNRRPQFRRKAGLMSVLSKAPDPRLVPVSQRPASDHVGRNNVPLADGGKPFKTNKAAKDAKKNQPLLRVVRVEGGFALAPKTEAQITAEAKNAKRLAAPRFGNPGVPLAAHEFIAGRGGLRGSERSDMGMEGNTRVGNRFLFASAGGMDMDEATEALKEAGYLKDDASHDDARNLISRSLKTPQYTAEGTEQMAEREQEERRKAFEAEQEAIALAQEAEDNELEIAAAAFEEAMLDMPQGLAQSDMSMEDALLVAGYTQQELENERNQAERAEVDQGPAETPPGNGPQGDRGREGAQGEDQAAGSQSQGLTAPTRADVLRQQAEAEAEAQRKADGGDKPITRKPLTGDVPDMFNTQGSVFDQPAEPEPAPEPAAAPAPTTNPDTLRAQADLQNALADLADIFGKNTRATIMPEQEQKLLPVLVKVFDAAFRLGYHKFKDAAKFALDQIRKALGDDAANAITLDHLQGAYISMAGGKTGVDTKRAVIGFESIEEITGTAAPAATEHKVGDLVKLTKPGVNGPINIAGRIERILPDGRLEIRTQQDGIFKVAPSELGHKPTSTQTAPATPADGVTRAAAGGQFGKNGEWYEGGQILPTSEFTIKGAQTQPNGPRNDAPTTDTTVEVTPAATIAGSSLVVEQKTSQRGKVYWSVSGDTLTHKDLLDALGFAKPFRMGGKWSRSVFDADPTERLAQALQGNMPAPAPAAEELPSLPADEAAAVLRQNKLEIVAPRGDGQVNDGIWTVAGKGTFDAKDTIKKVGGRWNGQLKAWSFNADPTGTLAYALKERGGPGTAVDDAGPGESDAEIERRRELRQREDARDDERADAGDASKYVAADTQALILRGEKFGIPRVVLNEQIEDIGLIVNAHQKGKPLFLLANEAGTGKTMVLGGAIRELRTRGESKFVYVTMNTDLIAQIKKDLSDYGIDDVDFHTYSELSAKGFDTAGSILIFDEAHNVKNVGMETARANKAQDLIAQAKMTIMASATLFENPVEARYLASTGIFDSVGGFPEWAKMYGASVKVRKFYNPNTGRQQTEEIIYWAGRGKKEDGAAARAWLFKQAIMTQRAMKIEPGMVDVQFRRNAVDAKWVDLYDRVQEVYDAAIEAWTDENGMPRDAKIVSEIARHRENTVKRVLEASKTPFAIKDAQELLAAGRNVVIFVETKADRTLGKWRRSENFKDDTLYSYEQMREMMAEWKMEADAARMQNERAPQRPFAEFIYTLAGYFDAAGLVEELPSTSDQIVDALGADKVGIYTGSVSNAAAGKNKADFLAGRKKVLVATMAKGGTGLSLHDVVGNRPTTQLNINLPWKATGVDQVAARVARYGLRSKTEVRWLFASNIPWESQKLAPRVGARMRDMGAIVKGIEVKAAEVLDGNFDFEGDLDVKGGSSIGQQDEGDIYAKAVRMEKLRRKADDTSGGFFETPFPLAALMTKVSGVRAGHSLLEPSAGRGNLLRLLPDGVSITAVEQREDNHFVVSKRHPDATVQRGDFMEFEGEQYDTILMNPPFERVAGVGAQDVAHVQRAYGMLKDGGRMAAIMGEGAFFRDYKQEQEFREWLDDVGATVIQMPEGAFKQSGTGVRTRMVIIDKNGESGRTDLNLQDMDPASLKAIEALVPSRHAVENAAIAGDGAARYDVNEPGAPYETDIFGNPLPQAQRSAAPARPTSAGVRGNVQPSSGVQDTPAPAGEYFASTLVGSEVSRELGASRITKPEHAAQATAYLYKSAVERLDGIVTDANGKPLGIVGGFKGALAQASVYPATLMAEAVRIPGAARIWFSHNHPSGNPQLSRADENLNQVLTDVFRGSGIEPMGLLAIGDGRFSHVGNSSGGMISNEQIPAPTSRVSVPVIERTLAPNGITGTTISSPAAAKQHARDFYDRAKQPGLMLLNSQNSVIGWVPITDQMRGELRGTGGMNAIYRAISESNAGAAIIVHGGELTYQSIPKQFPQVTPSENIAAALAKIDVRPLDSIEIRPTSTKSTAESGLSIASGPVFARGNPFYSALSAEAAKIPAKAQSGGNWLLNIQGLVKAGKVKQDEVDWSGVLDWLRMQGAQPVYESGFGLVEEMKNDAGQWQQVDDLGMYYPTIEEAKAAITQDIQDDAKRHGREEKTEARIVTKKFDSLDFGKRTTPKITREQLVQFLDANGVRVEETVLGGGNKPPGYDADLELLSDNGLTLERNPEDPSMVAFMDENGELLSADELAEEPGLAKELVLAAYRVQEAADADKVPTRYANYQLPGGTNYREVLLTLPAKSSADPARAEYEAWASRNGLQPNATFTEERYKRETGNDVPAPRTMTAMNADAAQNFKSSHWDQPNVLAHIRVNDRVDVDGKRVLFVEEIQSDWGQAGKKQGFDAITPKFVPQVAPGERRALIVAMTEAFRDKLVAAGVDSATATTVAEKTGHDVLSRTTGMVAEYQDLLAREDSDRQAERASKIVGIPSAPFVTKTDAWLSLALKRIVKMAADGGYDRVAFVNGEQSAERYDLSKQVRSIVWTGRGNDTEKRVTITPNDGNDIEFMVQPDGAVGAMGRGSIGNEFDGKRLDDIVGKDVAERIMGDPYGDMRGNGLKVGGEGMKAFYDRIVPNTLKDVLRKVGGGAVEKVSFGSAAKQAGWRYEKNEDGLYDIYGPDGFVDTVLNEQAAGVAIYDYSTGSNISISDQRGNNKAPAAQPGFTITPAMREKAAGGLPMFDRNADLAQLEALLRAVAPGRSETAASVRDMVSPLSDKWSIPITVVQRPDQLPVPAPSDARGLYHNGAIYLVASNLNSRAAVMRTLGHEAIAHHGLREMLGDDGFSSMMRQINMAVKAGNPAMRKISEYVRRTYVDENGKFELTPEQEADEIAARAVEDGIDPESGEFRPGFGWLKGVFARVAQFLRDLGITIPMSNTELQGVLVNSMRGLEAGAKLQGQGKMAAAARSSQQARGTNGLVAANNAVVGNNSAITTLNRVMRNAGWEVEYVDLDLTAEKPKAGIRVNRNDGRFLIAKVDAQGRASFETFQRERSLRMDESTKGRRPLSPMVDDTFLGRQRFEGARSMLRGMTAYLADNALNPIALSDMRSAWAGVMAGPVKQEGALPAPDSGDPMSRKGAQTDSPEFKAWFGDSKAVEMVGGTGSKDAVFAPMRLFHTTRNGDFNAFEAGRTTVNSTTFGDVETTRAAIFFTPSVEDSNAYGKLSDGRVVKGANTIPVYLKTENPLDLTEGVKEGIAEQLAATGFVSERFVYNSMPHWEMFDGENGKAVVDAARAAGYDSIIFNDVNPITGDTFEAWAVFDPEQIKSAIGNSGAFDPKNPDIRFARSVVTGATIPQAWQAPDPSKMDDFLYTMQDKHIDTKRVVTAVRDAIGGIADNLDPYLQEELYHGRAAKATKDFLEQAIRPLMVDMQARGVEMSDFEEYLHNRHAERRNEQVAKVNPNMPDGGSGIKTADARAYLSGLSPAKRTAYQALARRVDQMNRDTRALLVSSGLEKQSTIDAWQAAYGDEYVPLMREEMDQGAMGIGQGFSVRGSSSKRAMGSNKPVANILANIALQREKAITRAEKRRIGEALYGMVLSAPNPDFWFAIDPALEQSPAQITATSMQLISMGLNPIDAEAIAREPRQRYIDPRTGQVAERINPVLRSADNVLAVRIDGEDKYVFFNAQDPRAMRMAKSLKNLDSDQLGVVMGNAAKMTRYFSSINTQYNPIFGVVNLVRDIQTALLNLQSTRLAGQQAEVMKHVGSALRGIYIDLRDHRAGKQPKSSWANLFEEFQREGGATGYRDMYANAQDRADAITDELKKLKQGKAISLGRGIMGWLSDYNESMENAVRLATYKVAKESGMSNQQAASVAKNLTVNFNRKGQVALQAGALYAFFNASVQGTARMAETMFEGKKLSSIGKKIITGGLLLGSMQALLLAAAGYDDEEPPDFVRERSLVLPIGGDKYVSIPMPLGFHVIPNLARIPTEWALGGFRDTPKRLAQLVGLFADAFNPIGSAGLSLQTLAPTIIDPLAALAENRDWTGKPIAKKDFNSMQPTAGHTRAKDTATPWGRAIAYGVNWVTGGTDYKPGIASPTPDQIDYLIGQATGGVGREASKLSQVGSATVSGEELPLYKIPLIGRFVGTTAGQAAESGRFYENLKQIGEHDAELTGLKKDRRMSEYQQYMRENPEARMVPMAERTYREVSKLMRMKRDAIRDGASQERVRMLDQQITARMRAFNQRVRATEPAT